MRILLAENDELLGSGVCEVLRRHHYMVDWIKEGKSARHALLSEHFDMAILSTVLPDQSGLDVLKVMRANNITIPVIIIATIDSVESRIHALDSGADDYMLKKPFFNLEELCARIRALQRRIAERAEADIKYGKITLSPEARSVLVGDTLVETSRREFALLQKLLENTGRVLSREQLIQTLYGWADTIDSNALEVHIHNLRKKFSEHLPIKTVRGIGYTLPRSITKGSVSHRD